MCNTGFLTAYNICQMIKLVVVFVLVVSVKPWWEVGHLLTAAVAQIQLAKDSPSTYVAFNKVITSINSLVDNRSQTFIESACWPDDIKPYNTFWNSWHFKDCPYVYDGVQPILNYTESISSSVYVVNMAKKVLANNRDKATAEKALLARYLVHLAGDIHQPLHSVALFNETYPSGDQGGNKLSVVLPNGTSQNFHSFWDSGANQFENETFVVTRPFSAATESAVLKRAQEFMTEFGGSLDQQARLTNPAVWTRESFDEARSDLVYAPLFQTNVVSQDYIGKAYALCRKKVVLGGLRLANVLKEIYLSSAGGEIETDQELIRKGIFEMIKDNQGFDLEHEDLLISA